MKKSIYLFFFTPFLFSWLYADEPDMLLESGAAYDVYLYHGKAQMDYEGGSGSKNHGRTPPMTFIGSVSSWAIFENGATVTFRGHDGRIVLQNTDPEEVALPLPNVSEGEDPWRYSRSNTADLGVVAGNVYEEDISKRWEVNGIRKGEAGYPEDTFAGAGILSIRRDTPNYSRETFSNNMKAELLRIGVSETGGEWEFPWINYEKIRLAAQNLFPGAQARGEILVTNRYRNYNPVEGFDNTEFNTLQTTVPLYKYATGTPIDGSLYEPVGSVYVNHHCVSGRIYIGNNAYVRVYMRDPSDGIELQYPKREGVWRDGPDTELQLFNNSHYTTVEGTESKFTVSLYTALNPHEEKPYGVEGILEDYEYALWDKVDEIPPTYTGDPNADDAPDHYFEEPENLPLPFATFEVDADNPNDVTITYQGAERTGTMNYQYQGGGWKSRHVTSDGLDQRIKHTVTGGGSTLTVTDETFDENDTLSGKVVKLYENFANAEGHSIGLISGWSEGEGAVMDNVSYPVVNDWRLKSLTVGMDETRISSFEYNGNGLLESAIYPDGDTESYEYEGRLVKKHTQSIKADSGSGSMETQYEYVPLDSDAPDITVVPRTVTQRVGGLVVGKSFSLHKDKESHHITATSSGAAWNDAANLVTKAFFDKGFSTGAGYPNGLGATSTIPGINHDELEFTMASGKPDGVISPSMSIVKGVETQTKHNRLYDYPLDDYVSWIEGENSFDIEYRIRGYDNRFRVIRTDYLDGSNTRVSYTIDGVQTTVDRNGIVTLNEFNGNSFVTRTTHAGLTMNHDLGNLGVVAYSSPEGLEDQDSPQINGFGQLVSREDPVGRDYGYNRVGSGGIITNTTTLPGGATSVQKVHADGSLISISGSAQHAVNYIHQWGAGGGRLKVRQEYAGNTGDFSETYYDLAGRISKVVGPSPSGSGTVEAEYHYEPGTGLLKSISRTGGLGSAYEYDDMKWAKAVAVDVNGNGNVDRGGSDQVTEYVNSVELVTYPNGVRPSRVQTVTIYTDSGSLLISKNYSSLDGLASKAEQLDKSGGLGLTTSRTTSRNAAEAQLTTTQEFTDGSTLVSVMKNKLLLSEVHTGKNGEQVSSVSYNYGPYNRLDSITDAGTGTTTYAYNLDGSVKSVTSPNPGGAGGEGPHVTNYLISGIGSLGYTPSGGMKRQVTINCGKVTLQEHFPTGEVYKISGDVQYPQEYTYDYAGRKKSLKTWRNAGDASTAAPTTWEYNAAGYLTQKKYPGNDTLTYTYYPHGGLNVETLSRSGLTKTHSYNNLLLLDEIDYSDMTPDVSYEYDRLGRMTKVTDGVGIREFEYSSNLLLDFQEYTDGVLSGIKLQYDYDNLRRRTGLIVLNGMNQIHTVGRDYDGASRINEISGHGLTHSLTYGTNRPTVNRISNADFQIDIGFDNFLRTASIATEQGGNILHSSTYTHNGCGLRDTHSQNNGEKWSYTYDKYHQLKTAVKRNNLNQIIPGSEYAYNFDDIGNLKDKTVNGNITDVIPNEKNQAAFVTFPKDVDITGLVCTPPTTLVTVNGSVANLTPSGFWYKEITTTQPDTKVDVFARDDDGNSALKSGHLFNPQEQVIQNFDKDGNLTHDEKWVMEWDGENRLVRQYSRQDVGLPPFMQADLTYIYDAQGRRIRKETTANGDTQERLFIYDGWNLIAELDGNKNIISSHVWGLDKSMTAQGAGGVGGLLSTILGEQLEDDPGTTEVDESSKVCSPLYDGNGNITGYFETRSGNKVASYEYGPFGETKGMYGPLARRLPFRFSSKYLDEATDQLYYGYRYYKPSAGRWISRDPIQEDGGINMYEFSKNNPINYFDKFGLESMNETYLKMFEKPGFQDAYNEVWEGLHDDGMSEEDINKIPAQAFQSMVIMRFNARPPVDVLVKVGHDELAEARSLDSIKEQNEISKSGWYKIYMGSRDLTDEEIQQVSSEFDLALMAITPAARVLKVKFSRYLKSVNPKPIGGMVNASRQIPTSKVLIKSSPGQEVLEKTVAPKKVPCFPAGTIVATPSGDVEIQDLQKGDIVYAYDFETGKVVEKQVTDTYKNFTYYWLDIDVGSEVVTATRKHRFWVESEQEWIPAIELTAGMTVRLKSGEIRQIQEVVLRELESPEDTFNLEVSDEHNYFVGSSQALVHNGYPESPQYPPATQVGENFQFNFDDSPDHSRSRAAGVRRARATGNFAPGGEMHHINSVKTHPHLAAEPDNLIRMPDRATHLEAHGGNFQNPTKGKLNSPAQAVKPGC
jgi:RHS repeat-associated protein